MAEHTPSMTKLREAWVERRISETHSHAPARYAQEFDRAIAAHVELALSVHVCEVPEPGGSTP